MLGAAQPHRCLMLSLLIVLGSTGTTSAQCTVGDIIAQMASSSEAMELSPPSVSEDSSAETQQAGDTSAEDITPEFVFTPEIQPDQRRLLRRVGQACAWTSDVSNCTFRRVARMALRGRDADFIYDKCSD